MSTVMYYFLLLFAFHSFIHFNFLLWKFSNMGKNSSHKTHTHTHTHMHAHTPVGFKLLTMLHLVSSISQPVSTHCNIFKRISFPSLPPPFLPLFPGAGDWARGLALMHSTSWVTPQPSLFVFVFCFWARVSITWSSSFYLLSNWGYMCVPPHLP
jgi:hypothetical protein